MEKTVHICDICGGATQDMIYKMKADNFETMSYNRGVTIYQGPMYNQPQPNNKVAMIKVCKECLAKEDNKIKQIEVLIDELIAIQTATHTTIDAQLA